MMIELRGATRLLTLALLATATAAPSFGEDMMPVVKEDTMPMVKAEPMGKMARTKPVRPVPRPMPMPPEIPLPVAFTWSGFYAGGSAGGAHGVWTSDFFRNNNHGHAAEGEDGLEAGGFAGYNTYLTANIVYGAEADLGFTSAKSTNNIYDDDTSLGAYNAFGSIRGRLGYAKDRWLAYGTAGIAFANITNDIQKGVNPGEQIVWEDQTRTGYAVGAGLEYALTDHWIGRAEYLYENFGTVTLYNTDGNQAVFNNQLHQLRVGVSYKF